MWLGLRRTSRARELYEQEILSDSRGVRRDLGPRVPPGAALHGGAKEGLGQAKNIVHDILVGNPSVFCRL